MRKHTYFLIFCKILFLQNGGGRQKTFQSCLFYLFYLFCFVLYVLPQRKRKNVFLNIKHAIFQFSHKSIILKNFDEINTFTFT